MKTVKIIRLQEVINMTGLARATIYKKMATNEFIKSIKLGARSIGFIESEVIDWINERIEERDIQIKAKNNHEDAL